MKVKNLDRDNTIRLINELKLRVSFNNELNKFVRKYMKEHDPKNTFNGYHDVATDDMIDNLLHLLSEQTWMSDSLKTSYLRSCAEIFGQVYGPHVNQYVLTDLHDCEKHLDELEKAAESRVESNEVFRVERDLKDNRLNIFFDDVPEQEVRIFLKKNGFKWSPHIGAWTRLLNDNAEQALLKFKKELGLL